MKKALEYIKKQLKLQSRESNTSFDWGFTHLFKNPQAPRLGILRELPYLYSLQAVPLYELYKTLDIVQQFVY